MISLIFIFGLNEVEGSWNTIWMCWRVSQSSLPLSLVMSLPWKKISPSLGVSSQTRKRMKVLLPQPDSPTRPRVLPLYIFRLTSLQAVSSLPPLAGKRLVTWLCVQHQIFFIKHNVYLPETEPRPISLRV